jgi:hypothetical protein
MVRWFFELFAELSAGGVAPGFPNPIMSEIVAEQYLLDQTHWPDPSSEGMERHEFVRRRVEEMPPELRKLLARFGECAVPHLRNPAGIVQL